MKMEITRLMILLAFTMASCVWSEEHLLVGMTLVHDAASLDALCLDGSPPAYHLHRGFGAGEHNWLLQFEGGGWCNDIPSCLDRAKTHRGSTTYMNKLEVFSGILSNNASLNPDFYNWNRVKLRYCDGASFAGDTKFDDGKSVLYFKGRRIWDAIIRDLLPKGLGTANNALLSGCSAGGLSTFMHCDNLKTALPPKTIVKCLSDAGFFLDLMDISLNHTMRSFFQEIVTLQGIEPYLNQNCTKSQYAFSDMCFFPQYALQHITVPYFILNSAYDVYQFHHGLVPPSADLPGRWNCCKVDPAACTLAQIKILQGLRRDMLTALSQFNQKSETGGMFINSCFAHCQSESQDTWFAENSPKINNKRIAEAVGDWYFDRGGSKEIGCEYPCDSSCHNLIPA